ERNGGQGVHVTGNGNHVSLLQLDGNGGGGLRLAGTGNLASRNVALRNGGDGLEIQGASATLDRNRATNNRGFGLPDEPTGGGTRGNRQQLHIQHVRPGQRRGDLVSAGALPLTITAVGPSANAERRPLKR